MKEEKVSRTIPIRLETSNRKNEYLQGVIDQWQEVLKYCYEVAPSYPEYRQGNRIDTHKNRQLKKNFGDYDIKESVRNMAFNKVSDMYSSWHSNGHEKDRPSYTPSNYVRMRDRDIDVSFDNGNYGVKLSLVPYNPEWFSMIVSDYQEEYLEKVVDEERDAKVGASELFLDEDGSATLNLVVSQTVIVDELDDVYNLVGVDVGENVLFTTAVLENAWGSSNITGVELKDGREYRHYRDMLDDKKARRQREGRLGQLKSGKIRHQRQKYTEQVLDTASRRVVDKASDYQPSAIILEDMVGYRESSDNPIHDFPYGALQEKIMYKATEAGVPVEKIDPSYTSQECNKCGSRNTVRNGTDFDCRNCGYHVHADVNGAINIARRGVELL